MGPLDKQIRHNVSVTEAAESSRPGQIEDDEPQVDVIIDERNAEQFWWRME